MTSNSNLTQSRDQLMQQMTSLANESNFYSMLEQTLKQILQCKALSPYLYLHRKTSLRSKFDNTKTSQYTCQLAIYLSNINPLLLSKETITSKLMSLCIDKFNHLKIKKFQTNQFINFLLVDLSERDKAEFIKSMNEEKMENDNLPVAVFANVMYWVIVYLWAVREINQLANRLKTWGVSATSTGDSLINCEVLNEYLDKVDREDSILKMIDFGEVTEGENILDKVVARIFELFNGNCGSGEKQYTKKY